MLVFTRIWIKWPFLSLHLTSSAVAGFKLVKLPVAMFAFLCLIVLPINKVNIIFKDKLICLRVRVAEK